MDNEQDIEALIQAKGLTRPRITPEHVDRIIRSETFTVLPVGKTVICELTLWNGFTVRGESSVVSKENFDEAIGKIMSRGRARQKIWELEGYLLQQRLFEQATATDQG